MIRQYTAADAAAKYEAYRRAGHPLTPEQVVDELVAEYAGRHLREEGAIRRLAGENRTLAEWVRGSIRALAQSIREKLGRSEPTLKHAQRLWERAFRAAEQHASRQNPSVPLPGPETPTRCSIREEIDSSHSGEYTGENTGKEGNGAGTRSNISSEMQNKILEGQRVGTSNKIIGGHSPNAVNNNSPNFAVEEIKINADGTKVVKYYKQFPDGNVSRLKISTLFPDSWTDSDIIDAVQNIADSKPIGVRQLDGQSLHRGIINGIEIDVIKQGNDVISGYPVSGKPTPGFDPVNN